jgi:hypothetical protein
MRRQNKMGLSVAEVRAEVGVSLSSAYRLSRMLGARVGRRIVVSRESLARFLADRERLPAVPKAMTAGGAQS